MIIVMCFLGHGARTGQCCEKIAYESSGKSRSLLGGWCSSLGGGNRSCILIFRAWSCVRSTVGWKWKCAVILCVCHRSFGMFFGSLECGWRQAIFLRRLVRARITKWSG